MNAKRYALLALILAAIGLVCASPFVATDLAGRLLDTASAVFGLSAIFQAHESGWFERASDVYTDENKYPGGPPSHYMRRYHELDHPDYPTSSWIKMKLFYESSTAIYLAIAGLLTTIAQTWIAP